jgi:hypothetical protein
LQAVATCYRRTSGEFRELLLNWIYMDGGSELEQLSNPSTTVANHSVRTAEWGTPSSGLPFPSTAFYHSPLGSYQSTRDSAKNHSFAVYAQARLGTTIWLSFSRAPLIPLQGLAPRLFSCPLLRFYSVWTGARPNFALPMF